jgi:hypothetical protein
MPGHLFVSAGEESNASGSIGRIGLEGWDYLCYCLPPKSCVFADEGSSLIHYPGETFN